MKRAIIVMSLLLISLIGAAQTGDSLTLEQRVQSLEKKVAAQEKLTDKLSKYVHANGYIQAGYEYNDAGKSSFFLKRARVTLSGDVYKGSAGAVDYKVQMELSGSVKILDMYARYMPVKEFGLKAGQFKSPFTIENSEYAPTALEFVNYALMTQRFARMSDREMTGISASGRDLGMEFLGSALHRDGFSILNYELAVFNGYKINSTDDNKSKDIVGRLIVKPFKEFSIAGYAQYGEGNYPVFNDETQKLVYEDDYKYHHMYRYGAGLAYKSDESFVRAEAAVGKISTRVSRGAYIAAGQEFIKNWLFAGRVDYFDENVSSKKIFELNYTAALTYKPIKNLSVALNYVFADRRGGAQDSNGLYLMFTTRF